MRISDWSSDVCSSDLGRGVIAVDVAEIALPVDQRVAHREVLGQPHQGVIDRCVAMRVELAHDVADHARRLLERRPWIEPELPHREQQAPVNRLQTVAYVRKRARHDGRQRRSEAHTSELQSLMRISYAVFCLKKK